MNNVEEFEKAAASIFEELAKTFPTGMEFRSTFVADTFGLAYKQTSTQFGLNLSFEDNEEITRLMQVWRGTIKWLQAEGYIFASDEHSPSDIRLTAKGLKYVGILPQTFDKPQVD